MINIHAGNDYVTRHEEELQLHLTDYQAPAVIHAIELHDCRSTND